MLLRLCKGVSLRLRVLGKHTIEVGGLRVATFLQLLGIFILLALRELVLDDGFTLYLVHQRLVEVEILAALAEVISALAKPLSHIRDFLFDITHALLLDAIFIGLKALEL